MSLPDLWIDRLFSRLAVRYGRSFLAQYDGIELDAVKADWAQCLGRFGPDAIRHALDHMSPDRPPNVAQFRALCNSAPPPPLKRLPPPQATPEDREKVRRILAELADKLRAKQ